MLTFLVIAAAVLVAVAALGAVVWLSAEGDPLLSWWTTGQVIEAALSVIGALLRSIQ